jgi:hypothetical protein
MHIDKIALLQEYVSRDPVEFSKVLMAIALSEIATLQEEVKSTEEANTHCLNEIRSLRERIARLDCPAE